jgi:hypothetical protein
MRRHLFGAYAVVPLVLLMAVAACARSDGGSKVASVSGTASPSASASDAANLSLRERALKFAQCMRDHGVPMEDPQFDGDKVQVQIGEAGAVPDKSKVQAAQEACKQWAPVGGPGGARLDPQKLEELRNQAQCMRDNGVENFPDPSPEGGIAIDGSVAEDPDFDAAQEKCMKDLPKGGQMKKSVDS